MKGNKTMNKRFILGALLFVTFYVWGQERPVKTTPQDFRFPQVEFGDTLWLDYMSDSCLVLQELNGFHVYVHKDNATFIKYMHGERVASWPFENDTVFTPKKNEDGTPKLKEDGAPDNDTVISEFIIVNGEKLNDLVPIIMMPQGDTLCVVYKAQLISESKEKTMAWSSVWNVLKWILNVIVGFMALLYFVFVTLPKLKKLKKKIMDGREKRRFEMDFRMFADAEIAINRLQEKANESKCIKFDCIGKSISFTFAKNKNEKVKPFVSELETYLLGEKGVLKDDKKRKEVLYDEMCKTLETVWESLKEFLEGAKNPGKDLSRNGNNASEDPSKVMTDLKAQIEDLKKYKNALEKVAKKAKDVRLDKASKFDEGVERLQKAVENWEDLTSRLSGVTKSSDVINKLGEAEGKLKDWASKVGKKTPEDAEAYIKELEEVEDEFDKFKKKLRKEPGSFENDPDYIALSDLIKKAHQCARLKEEFGKNPKLFEDSTETGKLIVDGENLRLWAQDPSGLLSNNKYGSSVLSEKVRSGILLDSIKSDPLSILDNEALKGTKLRKVIAFVKEPETIDGDLGKDTGLLKLIKSIDNLAKESSKVGMRLSDDIIVYSWLKPKMSAIVENYNQFIEVEKCAENIDTDKFNPSALKDKVKEALVQAKRYVQFESYKSYWKNIVEPVFTTLNTLQNYKIEDRFDEIRNTRALLFYTSQFYSIACIMNEIYGDDSQPTKRAKLNVKVFKDTSKPALTHFGYPEIESSALESCKFTYKGGRDEDEVVKYLKQYRPLNFIFIQSYYTFDN